MTTNIMNASDMNIKMNMKWCHIPRQSGTCYVNFLITNNTGFASTFSACLPSKMDPNLLMPLPTNAGMNFCYCMMKHM